MTPSSKPPLTSNDHLELPFTLVTEDPFNDSTADGAVLTSDNFLIPLNTSFLTYHSSYFKERFGDVTLSSYQLTNRSPLSSIYVSIGVFTGLIVLPFSATVWDGNAGRLTRSGSGIPVVSIHETYAVFKTILAYIYPVLPPPCLDTFDHCAFLINAMVKYRLERTHHFDAVVDN
ncbi:hypothetical protein V5O48_017746, partial [Marasmius crinis-equi]